MSKKMMTTMVAVLMLFAVVLSACTPAATATTEPTAVQATDTVAAKPTATTGMMMSTSTLAPTNPPPATGPYEDVDPKGQEVIFWHQMNGGNQEALDAIVADFNATNTEGITVTAIPQGSYNDIYNKMTTILNTTDVPSLVVAYQNQAATYQLAGALNDMTPLVNSAKWGLTAEEQNDFFPGFWAQDIYPNYENARLGLPLYRSQEVMYYNIDWLKELGYDAPPATPEEFKDVVCKASQNPFSKATAEGASVGYEYYTGDASHMAAWTFAFGGNIYDSSTGAYTYNSDAAVNALTMLQGLIKDGCASLVAKQYGDQTDFGAGKTLFTTGSTSGINYYGTAVDEGAKFEWAVGPLPHTTADPVQNIYGASISMPKTTPENELASWLFLKFFAQPENLAKFAQATGYFPVRASAADSMSDFFSAHAAYKDAFDILKFGVAEPPVPGYDAVRDALGQAVSQALADPYPTVTDLLDTLNTDANAILQDQLSQMK